MVVRPSSALAPRDVPAAIEALQPDGSLMRTLLGVLGSDELLTQSVQQAHLASNGSYGLHASLPPGSNIVDVTVTADRAVAARRLADSFSRVASTYVDGRFRAYQVDTFDAVAGSGRPRPRAVEVVALGVLLGLVAAAGLVALGTWRSAAVPVVAPVQEVGAGVGDIGAAKRAESGR
jgi:capsular polysaccharide biosynthesis protein